MNFSVRHAMPGRLRLNVPELCRKRSLAEAVLRWLGWTVVMAGCMLGLRWGADMVAMPHGPIRAVLICGISGAVASVCFPYKAT